MTPTGITDVKVTLARNYYARNTIDGWNYVPEHYDGQAGQSTTGVQATSLMREELYSGGDDGLFAFRIEGLAGRYEVYVLAATPTP